MLLPQWTNLTTSLKIHSPLPPTAYLLRSAAVMKIKGLVSLIVTLLLA